MTRARPTLAIGGPTATGKTVLAVELARRIGAELINADSRQVVRRLRVGTAAPTAAELRGVPCHLLDECELGDVFTVAQWMARARTVLAELDARDVPAIVVGGTGQYLRALRRGWDFGGIDPDPAARAALTDAADAPGGLALLVAELRARDPDAAARIDAANPRRVIRALELVRAGGASLDQLRRGGGGRTLALVVLDAEPAVHGAALEARMEAMFGAGAILAEVHRELERGTSADALRRGGIGYAEALSVLDGSAGVEEGRAAARRRTRRYVKAQRTWFRHEPAVLRLTRSVETTTDALAAAVLDSVPIPAGSPRRGTPRGRCRSGGAAPGPPPR
jgi:tRNA dimethylallyltransferase